MCPLIQEKSAEQVNMAGHAPALRKPYDPYSNTYNPCWRDHPNFNYGGYRQPNFAPNRQQGYQQQYQPCPPLPPSNSSLSMEEMMKQLIANQQKTDSDLQSMRNQLDQIQKMQSQMSQMAVAINRLESQVYGKLSSQPELNLKNVSAIILRSGKEIQEPGLMIPKDKDEEKIEKELKAENTSSKNPVVLPDLIKDVKTNPPPFPSSLEKSKNQDKEKEILEVFCKVEINIPRLDAIKQVPKYAKFLRDLCVNRRRQRDIKGLSWGRMCQRFYKRNSYRSVGIQLADRTNAYPNGLIEDVLVKINDLVLSTDFYVFDMDDDHSPNPSPLLLGRPFLSTAQIKIDVNEGTLSMEFDEEIVHFNIFDTMEYLVNSHSVFAIHAINFFVQEFSEFACKDKFKVATSKYQGMKAIYEIKMNKKLRKKTALNGYLDLGEWPPITRKIELHPD
ncbi:uncharacterized protein [Coffea arabica]|uniref:Uncharacterized protein n=1 Tax=Coffea arabica TaxID=13443 RepID=A0A6P6WUE2_COFAR